MGQGMQLRDPGLQRRGAEVLRDLGAWKRYRVRTMGPQKSWRQDSPTSAAKPVYSDQNPGGSSPLEGLDFKGYQKRQNDSLGSGPPFLIAIM